MIFALAFRLNSSYAAIIRRWLLHVATTQSQATVPIMIPITHGKFVELRRAGLPARCYFSIFVNRWVHTNVATYQYIHKYILFFSRNYKHSTETINSEINSGTKSFMKNQIFTFFLVFCIFQSIRSTNLLYRADELL